MVAGRLETAGRPQKSGRPRNCRRLRVGAGRHRDSGEAARLHSDSKTPWSPQESWEATRLQGGRETARLQGDSETAGRLQNYKEARKAAREATRLQGRSQDSKEVGRIPECQPTKWRKKRR
jgi:hypothetical protein